MLAPYFPIQLARPAYLQAGFLATKAGYERRLPGRIIGVSKDAQGNRALRMAMQVKRRCASVALLCIVVNNLTNSLPAVSHVIDTSNFTCLCDLRLADQ